MPGRNYVDEVTLGSQVNVGNHLTGSQRFVFRPGGVTGGNVYIDFAALIIAMDAAPVSDGGKEIAFDNSANGGALITVPSAAYNFTDVRLTNGKVGSDGAVFIGNSGVPLPSAQSQVRVSFSDGATIVTGGRFVLENVDLRFIGATPLITTSGDLVVTLQNSRLLHDDFFVIAMISITSGDDLNLQMVDSIIGTAGSPGEAPVFDYLGGGGSRLTLVVIGHSFIGDGVFRSAASINIIEGSSSFGPGVTFQNQPLFDYVDPLRSPLAQGGRPTLVEQTVLTSAQLRASGGNLSIRQAGLFWFGSAVLPSVNDTLVIEDGSAPETYTFVAAAPGAFEVEIGANTEDTHANIVTSILVNSLLWEAVVGRNLFRLISNGSPDGVGVIVYRINQSKENFPDRLFGSFATGSPRTADFSRTLSYGLETGFSLPGGSVLPSTDPEEQTFGYGTIGIQPDGRLVYALAERHLFANRNSAGADGAEWFPVVPHNVQSFSEGGGGAPSGTIDMFTAFTTVLLSGATTLTLTLPSLSTNLNTPIPAMMYVVRRADSDATSFLNLDSADFIDGAGSKTVNSNTGIILVHDGTTWHRVSQSNFI